MSETPQHATDVISPAEARFWQEWADKAPALVRTFATDAQYQPRTFPVRTIGIGLGAALGAASFTSLIKGKWKWLSGAAAVASAGAGLMMGHAQDLIHQTIGEFRNSMQAYADMLEKTPQYRQQLADFLSSHISAEDIQGMGLDKAVADKTIAFAHITGLIDTKQIAQATLDHRHQAEAGTRGR